ncbi:MAG: HEAT repeat domain-containing protein [Planctomycetes bacterium]|nr:HEAT repeat domain-containing protein [Planctomycetota bacterium]
MADPAKTLTIAVLLLTNLVSAQTSKPAKPPKWPTLSSKEASQAKLLIRKLADEDTEVVDEAKSGLAQLGAGCALALLRAIEGQDEDVQIRAGEVLDHVLLPEHAPLVVKWLKKDKPAVQRYTTRRLARFRLPELKPTLESQLESEDEIVRFDASLGLASIGDFSHFDTVFSRCQSDWREVAPIVDELLSPQRGPEQAKLLAKDLRSADEDHVVTALRLMRSLCPKTHAMMLKTYLDASSHRIKRGAINALRVIVDGDKPLENLSAFQAIDHAKKWKERV